VENEGYISRERKGDLLGALMLIITAILLLSLNMDGFEATEASGRPIDLTVPNILGPPGALIAGILAVLAGDAAHLIYVITFIWALKLCSHVAFGRLSTRLVGGILLVGAMAGLLQLNVSYGYMNTQAGGALGAFVAERLLVPHLGIIASNVIGGVALLIGMLLTTDFLFVHFFLYIHRTFRSVFRAVWFVLRGMWRGFMWLLGARPPVPDVVYEDALRPIGDFCEQIPEGAFPPQETPARPGLFARLAGFALPRVSRRTVSNEFDLDESGDLPSLPDVEGVPEVSRSKKGKLTFPRLHMHDLPEEVEPSPELPFDEIPVLEIGDPGQESQAELFGDLFPVDTVAPIPETGQEKKRARVREAVPEPVAEDEEDDLKGEDGLRASLRHDAAAAKVVNTKKTGPRLRRKPVNTDELPPDYQYPDQYTPPSLDLFQSAERRIIPNLREKMGRMAAHLEETLATFNLEAKVTDVTRGPTITRFELEPAPGMKVSRFQGLTDDIALALRAKGVRVEAPIPGKGRVGIEISNEERDPVVIRELLEHPAFNKRGAGLDLALGKDIAGEVCIADLTRMPHLLVAGATGAGKTVCIKALLASLLFHHTPDELQLMLIDPKMVELSIFNDIPHLITPVVTDPKKASSALQWLITEMDERYRLFADLRVRNIEVYNDSVENGEIEMEGSHGSRKTHSVNVVRKLPFIVCIIDELADLMLLARAEVEESIMRLAQLARAVGIHLIIATQRPSVDVLTGVIKANFPARISFQVSSRVDSRCILDEIGAERLVGMGDMLYLPAGQSKPARIQGAFVSDAEMLALIAYLKRQAPPQYRDEIANFGKSKETLNELEQEDDPLLEDAVKVVLDTGQASISMVQRRLRVGYTRAARLIDMMELKGIVGPHTGSKAREILVSTTMKDDLT